MLEELLPFEHEVLEADMKFLAQEIARHKESAEGKSAGEAEILKKAIQTMPPQVIQQKKNDQQKKGVLPVYVLDAPAEVKLEVEHLLDFAFHHGIGRAVKEANKSPDFIRDAFHDALVKILSPEVKKRGFL